MDSAKQAFVTTGTISDNNLLVLDKPIPAVEPTRVRVIIILPDEADVDEQDWLSAAATNPSLDFLKDPEEDIYKIIDGRPFYDKR